MPVVLDVTIERTFRDKDQYPSDLLNKWETVLHALNDVIKARIQARIPDEAHYLDILANPAAAAYKDFVNPSFPNADIIKIKHEIRVKAGASDYINNVNAAFTKDPNTGVSPFMQRVSERKGKLANAIVTLDIVGLRYTDDWDIPAVVMMLTGDRRGELYLQRKGVSGTIATLTDLFPPNVVTTVRPQLLALLVRGGVFLRYAGKIGDETVYNNVLSTLNQALDQVMNLRDSTKYPTAYVRFEDPAASGKDRTQVVIVHAYVESA